MIEYIVGIYVFMGICTAYALYDENGFYPGSMSIFAGVIWPFMIMARLLVLLFGRG